MVAKNFDIAHSDRSAAIKIRNIDASNIDTCGCCSSHRKQVVADLYITNGDCVGYARVIIPKIDIKVHHISICGLIELVVINYHIK